MADVVVVGAGVVGAATSHALAAAGARVVVLEAGDIAGGTSAATFAADITPVKTPRALFDLAVRSGIEHEALAAACDGAGWRHRAGWLQWERSAAGRERVRERVRRLQSWRYPVEWISATRARQLEPALEFPAGDDNEIAFYPDAAWYEPQLFCHALFERARAHGATVHTGDPVTDMKVRNGRIMSVGTAAGRRVSADLVVNCAGPQAARAAGLANAELPLRQIPGLVVATTPTPARLATIVSADGVNVRPHGGGRLLLSSWALDRHLGQDADGHQRAPLAKRLLELARTLVPELAHADVQEARVGLRPVPPDGLPLVGFVPEIENLYVVVAHSGVHLAPVLGRLAAEELTVGAACREELGPFRPARLRAGEDGDEVPDESTRTMLAEIAEAAGDA